MTQTTTIQKLEQLLKDHLINEGLLEGLVSDLNSWDGSLESIRYYSNDEEFFELFFSNKPMEAVRATHYGEYNYNDNYVRFNGYGNLESVDNLESELVNHINDIYDALLENYSNVDINDFTTVILELISNDAVYDVESAYLTDEFEVPSEIKIGNLLKEQALELLEENNFEVITIVESLDEALSDMELYSYDSMYLYYVDNKYYIAIKA